MPYEGLIDIAAYLGVKITKTSILASWTGISVFKPNVQNIKTFIFWKLPNRFQPNLHNYEDYRVFYVGHPNLHPTNERWPPSWNL